jgi:hypothetical protein
MLTTTKIGGTLPRAMLFKHRIDAALTQCAEEKVRGVEGARRLHQMS